MLALIWAVFAAIFFAVGGFHLWESQKNVGHVCFRERKNMPGTIALGASDIDQPARDLATDLNAWVDHLNEGTRLVNRVETVGYGIAGLTAVLSALLELKVLGA